MRAKAVKAHKAHIAEIDARIKTYQKMIGSTENE